MRDIAACSISSPHGYASPGEAIEAVRGRSQAGLAASRPITGRRIVGIEADVNVVRVFLEGKTELRLEGVDGRVDWTVLQDDDEPPD